MLNLFGRHVGFYFERWLSSCALPTPGPPECDSEASGCPQFHFMPRFVRFLPGKDSSAAVCLPLLVSSDTALDLKAATTTFEKWTKRSKSVQNICRNRRAKPLMAAGLSAAERRAVCRGEHTMALLHCGVALGRLSRAAAFLLLPPAEQFLT